MKKKIITLFVVVMMCAFVGCGSVSVDNLINQAEGWAKEQLEIKKTNLWGIIIGCEHEAYNYKEKKNMVFCQCGANEFSDLTYQEFTDCVDFWDTGIENKEKYCIKAYVQYKGVDPIYLEFAEMLPKDKQKEDDIETQLELLGTWVEKSGEVLDGTLIIAEKKNDLEAVELIQSTADFAGVLGNAIDITQKVVNIKKLLDNDGDPQELINDFIDFVNGITSSGNGVYTMQLDVLAEGLNVFWEYYEIKEFNLEAVSLKQEKNRPVASWNHFQNPKLWVEDLENQNVGDLEDVYLDNVEITGNKLLPSVEDVCKHIENKDFDKDGEILATKYVMFRINYYLEKQMGITLEKYVEALDKLAQELNEK